MAWKQISEWMDRSSGFDLVTVLDAEYPIALRGIHQMPPMLFVKGELRAEEVGVSVVGSRKPTEQGRRSQDTSREGLPTGDLGYFWTGARDRRRGT